MRNIMLYLLFIIISGYSFSQSLGEGYRDTKWGMSPQEVRPIMMGYRTVDYGSNWNEGGDTIHRYFSRNRNSSYDPDFWIDFCFYQNKLYRVVYKPYKPNASTEKMLLDELKSKYGNNFKTSSVRTETMGVFSKGFNVTEWSDRTTKISFMASWMTDAQGRFNTPQNSYVEYLGIQINEEKQSAIRRAADERRNSSQNNLRNNL